MRRSERKEERRSHMADKARERAERNANRGGGGNYLNLPKDVTFWKPKEKHNSIDILPYKVSVDNHPEVKKGELWYQRTILVHYGIGAEELPYLCLKTVGKVCPICKAAAEMKHKQDADEEAIKALRPKERELYNVIDRNNEDAGVQLWEISSYLFGRKLEEELRNLEESDKSAYGFAELEGGKSLNLRFTEESMGKNTFLECSRIDFEDRDDYTEDILADTFDLDKALNILPYDKLEAIFLGVEADKDEEGDENEEENDKAVGKLPHLPPKRKPPVDDDEEENDKDKDEDEESDDGDDKTAPRRRRKQEPEEDADEDDDGEKGPSAGKGKCPHGGKWGEDCNELQECESCKKWDDCQDAQDELNKAKRKARREK